ncbi:MAG: nascent polypeptide-associated complex protein [Candidatus Micrarchaeota archaeon]
MMPGMNPKQMASLMKQMGIESTEMDCSRVVFEKADGSKTVVENPAVTKIEMKGQVTFQVMGEAKEELTQETAKGDVEIIMEQTGAPKEAAEKAFADAEGNLAEAITLLQEKKK